jgi:uncharacterized protein (TIGR02996 family)
VLPRRHRAAKNGYTARVLDTEGKRLYDAVVAAPNDDAPRLAMAAYLDRQGAPWGAFIRAQLALTRALRTGTQDEVEHHREEAKQLQRRHDDGKAWTNAVDTLVRHCEFIRGFVEVLLVDASKYLVCADELFHRAPIRHLVLTDVGNLIDQILQNRHLSQLVSLSIGNLSRKEPIGDSGLFALAQASNLRGLKMLDVSFQGIGMPGLEALCMSKNLPSLIYVNLVGNHFDDPREDVATDWATGMTLPESIRMPTLGKELEARYGDLPWLHGPSRLRHFPPDRHEL